MTATPPTTYDALAAPFEDTHKDRRGGVDLEYITGEQCVTRLNQVLGPSGWSFSVTEHGYNQEADEMWVLGALDAHIDGRLVARQQFGSQKLKRRRNPDEDGLRPPLDIGFDLKGATTDALKKCASLLGVGLYLSHKEAGPWSPAGDEPDAAGQGALICAECEAELKEVKFRDGTTWPPMQLASYGRRKHGRVLCMDCYKKANDALKAKAAAQAEAREEAVPF